MEIPEPMSYVDALKLLEDFMDNRGVLTQEWYSVVAEALHEHISVGAIHDYESDWVWPHEDKASPNLA